MATTTVFLHRRLVVHLHLILDVVGLALHDVLVLLEVAVDDVRDFHLDVVGGLAAATSITLQAYTSGYRRRDYIC